MTSLRVDADVEKLVNWLISMLIATTSHVSRAPLSCAPMLLFVCMPWTSLRVPRKNAQNAVPRANI